MHEFFKDIVSFDSRILRTVRALVIEPGELPLAFREGRTQRYMPSVRLYFFVSLLFFLFLSVTGIALMQITLNVTTERFVADKAGNVFIITNGKRAAMDGFKADAKGRIYLADKDAPHVTLPTAKADGSVDNKVDTDIHYFQRIGGVRQNMTPAVKAALASMEEESLADAKKGNASGGGLEAKIFAAMQKLETNPAALNGPLMTWIPRILFLLLPLFALLLAAFYRRLRNEFYFVDHLVFSLTIHTFAFIVLILAAIAAQLIAGKWVAILTVVVLAVYLLLSLKHFYGQSWVRTGLKFAGIGIIYPMFFLGPALVAAIVASVVAA